MKKYLLSVMLILTMSVFANGLSLNSIGTKAFGMGGAFVAVSDDPSAIHWNPAGLAGQKSSVLLFLTDVYPFPTYEFEMYGVEAEGKTGAMKYISPNLMAVYSYEKFGFGIGAYVPAGLGSEWDGADLTAFGGPATWGPYTNLFAGKKFEWMSKIAVFNIAPAIGYSVNDFFKLGAAMNFFYGMFEMKRGEDMLNNFSGQPGADGMLDTQTAMEIDGIGIGATFSAMIDNGWNSIGFTYKTPVTVDMEGTMEIENMGEYDMSLEVTWPAWYGAGLAFKPFDKKLIITSDIQMTNWKELETLYAKISDMQTPYGVMDIEQEMHLEWHDAVQLRFGIQSFINEKLTARVGYYFDPAPAPERTLNILFPSSTNQAYTAGFSYSVNNLNIDFGAEYLFGEERNVMIPSGENMPGVHQMDVFAYSLGFVYKF
jgi:long-chain fatty acid transport protein